VLVGLRSLRLRTLIFNADILLSSLLHELHQIDDKLTLYDDDHYLLRTSEVLGMYFLLNFEHEAAYFLLQGSMSAICGTYSSQR
jgi:hypothetical protein